MTNIFSSHLNMTQMYILHVLHTILHLPIHMQIFKYRLLPLLRTPDYSLKKFKWFDFWEALNSIFSLEYLLLKISTGK